MSFSWGRSCIVESTKQFNFPNYKEWMLLEALLFDDIYALKNTDILVESVHYNWASLFQSVMTSHHYSAELHK